MLGAVKYLPIKSHPAISASVVIRELKRVLNSLFLKLVMYDGVLLFCFLGQGLIQAGLGLTM